MISQLRYSFSTRTKGDPAGGGDETVSELKKLCFYPTVKDTAAGIMVELSVSQPQGDAYSALHWRAKPLQKNFEIPLW